MQGVTSQACLLFLALLAASAMAGTATYHSLPLAGWRLVTDGVMGGVSVGRFKQEVRAGRPCLSLSGDVSTENNGGFIQITLDLDDRQAALAAGSTGIRLQVWGNDEDYNVHLRTRGLWLPWQSFRSSFAAGQNWQEVTLPFKQFSPYKTKQDLDPGAIKRIGIVAIGRDYQADLCVSAVGFYRQIKAD